MCETSEQLMLATAVCEVRGLAVGDGSVECVEAVEALLAELARCAWLGWLAGLAGCLGWLAEGWLGCWAVWLRAGLSSRGQLHGRSPKNAF